MAGKKDIVPLTRQQLIERYGTDIFDHPPAITSARLERQLAQRDLLDQHFAKISMEFASGVLRRPMLDPRSRFLAQIGQFAVTKMFDHLEDAIRAALEAGVSPREALEAVHLCHVYSGAAVFEAAVTVFARVAREVGVLEQLQATQLPLDGRDSQRNLEAERKTWRPEEENDPRREHLTKQYGWLAVSTGFRYRGRHHLDYLEEFEHIDLEFGRLWETFTYQGMYSRRILDDKTRLLCTVGDCIALGAAAAASARDHMEEALTFGNTPRELFELICMTGFYFGFPGMTVARGVLIHILEDQGRLAELGMKSVPGHH